mmetsp:Transcript_32285/g.65200  ORF Transcript_32285/g.65200 Transcript_32285/m.65200 type:complete len:230 (-) Transcript_32285:374-1063(-)
MSQGLDAEQWTRLLDGFLCGLEAAEQNYPEIEGLLNRSYATLVHSVRDNESLRGVLSGLVEGRTGHTVRPSARLNFPRESSSGGEAQEQASAEPPAAPAVAGSGGGGAPSGGEEPSRGSSTTLPGSSSVGSWSHHLALVAEASSGRATAASSGSTSAVARAVQAYGLPGGDAPPHLQERVLVGSEVCAQAAEARQWRINGACDYQHYPAAASAERAPPVHGPPRSSTSG